MMENFINKLKQKWEDHSIISPSSFDNYKKCIGQTKFKYIIENNIINNTATDKEIENYSLLSEISENNASKNGTYCHEIIEKYGKEIYKDKSKYDYYLNISKNFDQINDALKSIKSILLNNDNEIFFEERVKIDELIRGSIDLLIINKKNKTLTILDYKFGANKVSLNSSQLKLYAYGALKKFNLKFDKIFLCLVQPETSKKNQFKETNEKEILDFYNYEVKETSEKFIQWKNSSQKKIVEEDFNINSSCKYCYLKLSCNKFTDYIKYLNEKNKNSIDLDKDEKEILYKLKFNIIDFVENIKTKDKKLHGIEIEETEFEYINYKPIHLIYKLRNLGYEDSYIIDNGLELEMKKFKEIKENFNDLQMDKLLEDNIIIK